MDEDELYATLPDDAGLAFVKIEGYYKHELEEAARNTNDNGEYNFQLMTYLNKVIAAAKVLDIPGLSEYELPENESNLWEFSRLVTRDIESLAVQIRIANARAIQSYSVALSNVEKEKARHFISQLDQLVDASACTQDKKEKLKKILSELREEIEQDRTRFDRIAEKLMRIARLSGDIEEEFVRPWWPYIKAFLGVVDEAKEKEEKPSLPTRTKPKKIESPRKQLPDYNSKRGLDDEIPF